LPKILRRRQSRARRACLPDQTLSYSSALLTESACVTTGSPTNISVDTMRADYAWLAGKSTTPEQQKNLAAFTAGLGDALLTRNHAAARDFLARNAKAKASPPRPPACNTASSGPATPRRRRPIRPIG